jgi:thiol-disulfide isomerase/thioredoxin
MSDRKPSPYSTFNNYNNATYNKQEEMNTVVPNVKSVRENFSQPNTYSIQTSPTFSNQPPQNVQYHQLSQKAHQQQQPQQHQPQLQQYQPQQHQQPQQQHQQSTRFKKIQSSEHLLSVLTNGLDNFRSSFTQKNMQPPTMKIFLKLYTEWCGPCKKIGPILHEMSTMIEYKDIIFLEFDADLMLKSQDPHSKKLTGMLKVGAVPCFFNIIDGVIKDNVFGADMNEINSLVNKLANS